MGDILDFKKKLDPKVVELIQLSNQIDDLAKAGIQKGFEISEVCGIIAHRLGSYIEKSPNKVAEANALIHILLTKAGIPNG